MPIELILALTGLIVLGGASAIMLLEIRDLRAQRKALRERVAELDAELAGRGKLRLIVGEGDQGTDITDSVRDFSIHAEGALELTNIHDWRDSDAELERVARRSARVAFGFSRGGRPCMRTS